MHAPGLREAWPSAASDAPLAVSDPHPPAIPQTVFRPAEGQRTRWRFHRRDVLTGGPDAVSDTFEFWSTSESSVGTSRDVINNFTSGVDKISLGVIDANTSIAGNDAFAFSGTVAQAYSIWFTDIGTDIVIRADVNGDALADMMIRVTLIDFVVVTDFLL